jgi:ABC-type lipoprotein export system ATPase subunit
MSNFLFDTVVPKPMSEHIFGATVWSQKKEFIQGKKYLVNAESGKGKSTLLAYMYGLRNDYSGSVTYNQKDLLKLTLNEKSEYRQKKVSMMFQDLRLFEELTGEENIQLKINLGSALSQSEIDSICSKIGVDAFIKKPVKHMSMGQQQRIAFVRALVQDFEWLLLDEPFSHLDANNRLKMEEIVKEVCEKRQAGLVLTNLGNATDLDYDEILAL